ncbi:MAG: quinone-dependent dihydroorotate dehydrogenase, partial [bacterium]
PNTPGLRKLQEPHALGALVGAVIGTLDDVGRPRPVLLKLHPDAPDAELLACARAALDAGASGLIAVNTTVGRPAGLSHAGAGGLSGRPLAERATRVTANLFDGLRREAPIIGVGGIFTGEEAIERVRAGASALQAYTGFVYRGPRFPTRVHREMVEALDVLGVDRFVELVGVDAPRLRKG